MSKYTTEVRFICEQKAGLTESVGYLEIDNVVTQSAPLIFDKFPIFDEEYRLPLETKILKHYYTREICEETVGLWLLRLNTRMSEIMPYYNKLYESELLEFDPFIDYDMKTSKGVDRIKNEKTKSDEAENRRSNTTDTRVKDGTRSETDTAWEMYSATPQGTLQNIENETYLTNATKNTDYNNVTTHETVNDTGTQTDVNTRDKNGERKITDLENYIESKKGKMTGITYSKMLNEFRETFLNIDKMIIDELSDLFFGLW